ncbi:alpha/beta hydrolase family protein [Actinomadura sp. 7K507]|uniref:alpha/beta hydrolase n=1 Tax=Actinomadura sp. 7K507 TaxID=2530365 RepID=UPI001049EA7E|nr:alpha/beta hydrolase family protein [Actinomadura sp. 7K507]TDC96972.1 esterase family protein [Actinomadura sp. 7K507]
MKKRTDRKIAIAGTAAAAVLLPAVMVGLAQAGVGVPKGNSEAAGNSDPVPSFGPATQPSAPGASASPSKRAKPASLPEVPAGTDPFGTGGSPAPNDPDRNAANHGKKPKLPPGSGSGKYDKAPNGATITGIKKLNPRIFDVTIASPALGAKVKTRVMTPKGWKAGSAKTWPTVYAYHGGRNNSSSWIKDSDIEQVVGPYNALVIMPEGGSNGSYANWYNGGKGGIPEWETHHIREVIPLMERNFGAGSTRAAIGLSSGGQGAIIYAERHRGLFKYAASYSGALNISALGMPAILTSMNGDAGTAIWGDPITARANWRAHDATVNVAKLKGVGVYVSSGNGQPGPFDDPNTPPHHAGRIGEQLSGVMTQNFVAAAKRAGVPVTSNLYGPGMHNWKYWKRELRRSWPTIASAIGARKS